MGDPSRQPPPALTDQPRPTSPDRQLRYFEDFSVGEVHALGSHVVTKKEIIGFASTYDPQPIHIDEEAARSSVYGGLIASGWHTGCLCMRHVARSLLATTATQGGRGVDELRWLVPVRPGDTLTFSGEVTDTTPSRTHRDRGYVDYRCTATNQHDDAVMTLTGLLLIQRRPSHA